MYRMASGLAAYATHTEHPQLHHQVEECADDLADLGAMARQLGIRLSFHPSQFIVLHSPDASLDARSEADVEVQASILEAMGLGEEAGVVPHVGGVYGDRACRARALSTVMVATGHTSSTICYHWLSRGMACWHLIFEPMETAAAIDSPQRGTATSTPSQRHAISRIGTMSTQIELARWASLQAPTASSTLRRRQIASGHLWWTASVWAELRTCWSPSSRKLGRCWP